MEVLNQEILTLTCSQIIYEMAEKPSQPTFPLTAPIFVREQYCGAEIESETLGMLE